MPVISHKWNKGIIFSNEYSNRLTRNIQGVRRRNRKKTLSNMPSEMYQDQEIFDIFEFD